MKVKQVLRLLELVNVVVQMKLIFGLLNKSNETGDRSVPVETSDVYGNMWFIWLKSNILLISLSPSLSHSLTLLLLFYFLLSHTIILFIYQSLFVSFF